MFILCQKKMLRVLIVSLIFIFSCFYCVYATSENAITYTDLEGDNLVYSEAVYGLSSAGVVNGFEDGSFAPTRQITRAQFAKMLVLWLNISKNNNGEYIEFTDLSSPHWAKEYIDIAVSNGIIVGYEDGSFKPEKDVTYAESYTMVVRALGYDNMAKEIGAWPTGYVEMANRLNINRNLSGNTENNEKSTRGNVAIILWNMPRKDGKFDRTQISNLLNDKQDKKTNVSSTYLAGEKFNKKIRVISSGSYSNADTKIHNIKWSEVEPDARNKEHSNIISSDKSAVPIYAWFDNGTIFIWSEAEELYVDDDCSGMFLYLKSLESLNLEKDLKVKNISNIKNISSMFAECNGMKQLDISNLDTRAVEDMSYLFLNCKALTELDVSYFNTSNVTNMYGMFNGCENLNKLDVSNFDTSKVTNMSSMFSNCEKLKNIDVSKFDTKNVENMSFMFMGCKSVEMLNVSTFDTSKVTGMESMFGNCESLKELDVKNFNTSLITNMENMFGRCSSLTYLDLNNFDTKNVTNMKMIFSNDYKLETILIDNFNTSNVTNMNSMFMCCYKLEKINLSSFKTDNLTDMGNMFNNCSSLKEINISHFNITGVKDGKRMFYDCSNLEKIYSSDFNSTYMESASDIFTGCFKLTGCAGTKYEPEKTGINYARIDGGESNPGYFSMAN